MTKNMWIALFAAIGVYLLYTKSAQAKNVYTLPGPGPGTLVTSDMIIPSGAGGSGGGFGPQVEMQMMMGGVTGNLYGYPRW